MSHTISKAIFASVRSRRVLLIQLLIGTMTISILYYGWVVNAGQMSVAEKRSASAPETNDRLTPAQKELGGFDDSLVLKMGDVAEPTPSPAPILPGGLDSSFGLSGRALVAIQNIFNSLYVFNSQSADMQSDGKVVFAGALNGPDSRQKFAVVRMNADGTLDTSFGNGGLLVPVLNTESTDEIASVVRVQPDQKILVAGVVQDKFGITRLDPSGAFDPTFGIGGRVVVLVNAGGDFPRDIAIQADGKIIMAGKSYAYINSAATLVRLTPSGQLDAGFNGTGATILPTGTAEAGDEFRRLVVQPDGKIVAAGDSIVTPDGSVHDFLVMRFNSDGSTDSTFGAGGKVLTSLGTRYESLRSVALQPDGKILVGGGSNNGQAFYVATLLRYESDGSIDISFGNSGKAGVDLDPNHFELFNSLLVQSDAKIIAVGSGRGAAGPNDFTLARFDRAGNLDASFGSGGLVRTSMSINFNESVACCGFLMSGGRLLVAGEGRTEMGMPGFAVARYFINGDFTTVSGRVLTSDLRGLRNATISMTDSNNVVRTTTTSSFGFFSFDNVATGQQYAFRVQSRLFRYAAVNITVNDALTLPDWVGLE